VDLDLTRLGRFELAHAHRFDRTRLNVERSSTVDAFKTIRSILTAAAIARDKLIAPKAYLLTLYRWIKIGGHTRKVRLF